MCCPHTGEALCFGFDHCTEVVAAWGRAVAGADGGEVVVCHGFMHEATVGLGAIQRRGGKDRAGRASCVQRVSTLGMV